jgi:hypothetical protein
MEAPQANEVTGLLSAWGAGDDEALRRLGPPGPSGITPGRTTRESGTDKVYVIPFDSSLKNSHASDGGSKWQISSRGGSRQGNSSWQYRLSTKTAAQVRTPETVLQAAIEMVIFEPYEVTRDGKKFVVNTLSDMEGSLTLMVNWRSRLKQ